MEHCGDSSEDGTTASYTPTKAFDLSEVYDAELIEGNDSDYINSTFSLDCRLYLGEPQGRAVQGLDLVVVCVL